MTRPPSDPTHAPEYVGRDLEAMDFAVRYHRWILDSFRPFLGPSVVEVGAGTGAFTELLLEVPIVARVLAAEPSGQMHAALHERLGLDPRVETRRALFSAVAPTLTAPPHAIVYVNVLEHVADDRAELVLAHDALRPGGHLCLFVPALPWLYSAFDAAIGHRRRYRKGELVEKVESAGFALRRACYFDAAGVLPWLIAFRLLGRTLGGGQVRLYDRLVVPVMRRLEGVRPPPVGKNLVVVGQRAG